MYCYISGKQLVTDPDYCGYSIVLTLDNRTLYSTAERASSELTDVGTSQVAYQDMTLDQRLQREYIKAAIELQFQFGNPQASNTVYVDNRDIYMLLTNWFLNYQAHGWKDSSGNDVPNDDLLKIYYKNWQIYRDLTYISLDERNNGNAYMMQLSNKLAECSISA